MDQQGILSDGPADSGHGHRAESVDFRGEIEDLQHRLGMLMARLPVPGASDAESPSHAEPEMDIYENDQEFFIFAAMPGIAPQDIKIDVTAHSVTLTAEAISTEPSAIKEAGSSGSRRHRRSRFTAHERYYFVYTLHAAIETESVRASFRHGMVEIHLPKSRLVHRPLRIPVRISEERSGIAFTGTPEQASPPYELAAVSPLAVRSHEGAPSQKMGQSYIPNSSEDHSMKAQSVGERSQSTGTGMNVPSRLAVVDLTEELDDPAVMEARSAGNKL